MVVEPFATWPSSTQKKTTSSTTKPPSTPPVETVKKWAAAYTAADAGSLGVTPKKTTASASPATAPSTAATSGGDASLKTDAQIRAFQAANGLTVDGIIGPNTQKALDAAKVSSADGFAERQKDINALVTASPAAAQTMQGELDADIKTRIADLDSQQRNLPTDSFSGYIRPALQAEQNELKALLPPTPSDNSVQSFADRQSDIDTIATASPAAAQAMRQELVDDVKNRIAERENELQNLPTDSFSGYVRPALQAELDELKALLPNDPLAKAPGGEDWLTDAQDGLTLETQNFTAGFGVDIPLGSPALEAEVGAEVQIKQQTRGDGSILITTQLSGEVGLEFAEIAEVGVGGRVSTQYRFDNQEDAQRFIDDLRGAARISWGQQNPARIAGEIANVYAQYREDHHVADIGGVELTAGVGVSHQGASLNVGGAAGATHNFTNGDTTYHASLSAGAAYDIGGGNKLAFSGSGRAALQVDDNGDAQKITITGVVNGSGPVDGLIEDLGLDNDGTAFDVVPGQRNSEGLAAQITYTIDLTDAQNTEAVADLVDSLIGRGDQNFSGAAQDLLDQADVRVTLNTSESGAFKADIEDFEFELGNSETELVAAWGRPPEGDFQQLT